MHRFLPVLLKALKFGLVGLSGLVLDFGITWLLKEKLRTNKYLANSCGFTIAVVNNYIWNRLWTFQSSQLVLPELAKFILFALIGLALNNLLLMLFHEKMKYGFYLSKALAIICVFAWNFLTNYFFNF